MKNGKTIGFGAFVGGFKGFVIIAALVSLLVLGASTVLKKPKKPPKSEKEDVIIPIIS